MNDQQALIERAAQVMCDLDANDSSMWGFCGECMRMTQPWAEQDEDGREGWRNYAQAVLEALNLTDPRSR